MDRTKADAWGERLPRRLGVWSAMAVLIGSTIGSGIFRVPATVAAQLQDPGIVMTAWALGGIVTLLGALTIAELAGALPRSGGIFVYILEAFGPLPAFLYGWSEMTVIRAAALGGIATICAEYLGYFVSLSAHQVRYVAAALIIAVGVINYCGIRDAARLMNLVTYAKFGALALLAALAFAAGSGAFEHFIGSGPRSGTPVVGMSIFATALIPVLWSYDGWSNLSFISGEVKEPHKTLPLALVLGTVGIIAVYLLINAAYLYLVPLPEMAQARLIAATAAQRIPLIAAFGAAVIAAIVMVSAFGAVHGSMMTGPRVVFAMAERGLFFRAFSRVSPKFESPSLAIGWVTAIGVVYVLQNDFAQLADKFILGIWPFYALAVGAVFVLRRQRPELPRPYRTWGYPVIPALFLAASLGLIVNALLTDPHNTGITFGVILAGIPIYFVWSAIKHEQT